MALDDVVNAEAQVGARRQQTQCIRELRVAAGIKQHQTGIVAGWRNPSLS